VVERRQYHLRRRKADDVTTRGELQQRRGRGGGAGAACATGKSLAIVSASSTNKIKRSALRGIHCRAVEKKRLVCIFSSLENLRD
jgi:hypothetical protein